MCSFGKSNVFNTVAFLVEFFFRLSNFQYLQKMGFSFFLKIVSASFLVSSHTLSNSFRLYKVKKVGLKFDSQNVT